MNQQHRNEIDQAFLDQIRSEMAALRAEDITISAQEVRDHVITDYYEGKGSFYLTTIARYIKAAEPHFIFPICRFQDWSTIQ